MNRGIDVSSYQSNIDWAKAKEAGVGFSILKVIRKDLSPDKQFENNWTGCEDAGVVIQGVYNYSYATSVNKAVIDAQTVLKVLQDRKPMVWLDIEDNCQKGLGQALINIIKAYGNVIATAGLKFGVYTGLSFYKSYILPYADQLKDVSFWIARYPSTSKMELSVNPSDSYKPDIKNIMYGWQYSSSGSVPGISGNIDMNEWYVDLEAETVAIPEEKATYQLSNFILDSRNIWEVSATAYANEIVNKTVTVSTAKNKSHAIITPLERYMKALGYYQGSIEADSGKQPSYGNGMKKAIKLYQEHIVKADEEFRDGVLTAKGATWKTLYGAK